MTKFKAKSLKDRSWRKVTVDKVLQGAGTQPLHTYLYRRKATVAEYVSLRPISEVCARVKGYEGRENTREPWWIQAAEEKQMRVMLEYILAAGRERWIWEPSRRGRSEGGD